LIGTRKGGFILRSNASRSRWTLADPLYLGETVYHMVLDPRDRRTMLMAARAGHLGPTVLRSTDAGKTWHEASRPPAFPKAAEGQRARAVAHVFWLTPGHASEPGVWYAGTSPQGLFRSEDGGDAWQSVSGFNDHPMNAAWTGRPEDGPPGGATLHSINVDPRSPQHLYIAMSGGGTFESSDGGRDWKPLNKGVRADFFPDPYPEHGQDVHCMRLHPAQPDRIYQQNHCGIYRLDRPGDTWQRIGDNMPKDVGDIGFPMTLHPRDANTAWVFPMDGGTVWPRTSPGGRPAVYRTSDAGATWQRQDSGLPARHAWFTVKRQAMCADAGSPVGLYFGVSQGEVWGSRDEGASWRCLARHLPEVYAIEAAEMTG
jgi:photosystem II stability/assembly factor-like uncharacterized protein